jgi:L-serine/L-threonine ammonia-lyase
MALHISTPLIRSQPLSRLAGRSLWLKLDALQPSGSFKIRGVGALCEHHVRQGRRRIVCSSGGNAGLAAAYAGRRLSVPVLVVVPKTTTEHAKTLLRQEDAEVIVTGDSWQEANAFALTLLDPDTAFVHPFDDPLLWEGHASLIDEAAAGCSFDAVALSVGGGGLLCGVVEGLARNGLSHVPVIAVETQGAASLARSLEAGQRIELPAITSVATSLGAKQVCARAFEVAKTHEVRSVVVSDRAAVVACRRFMDDHRLLVEPACGAALSLAYDGPSRLEPYHSVLMVVCGGATASLDQLQAWAASLG